MINYFIGHKWNENWNSDVNIWGNNFLKGSSVQIDIERINCNNGNYRTVSFHFENSSGLCNLVTFAFVKYWMNFWKHVKDQLNFLKYFKIKWIFEKKIYIYSNFFKTQNMSEYFGLMFMSKLTAAELLLFMFLINNGHLTIEKLLRQCI